MTGETSTFPDRQPLTMPLRIGFDMDGVLADFALAFHDVEERLFGPGLGVAAGEPEKEEQAQEEAGDEAGLPPSLKLRRPGKPHPAISAL